MTLFATQPIREGQEITISYTILTESREIRRGRLFDMYHFRCECECCNVPLKEVAASDAARLELASWSKKAFRTPVGWCKNLALPDEYLVEGYKRCIALREQERLIDFDYAMHIVELAVVYGMLADAENFKLWRRKALAAVQTVKDSESTMAVSVQEWFAGPQRNFKLWGMRIKEKLKGGR